MRLFIALNFDSFKDYFEELQHQIHEKETTCTFPKTFHLTLKFLGDLPDVDVQKVKESLSKVEMRSYQTSVGDIGVFPNEHHIRTVWVGLEDNQTIALQQRIEDALISIGKKSKESFMPHITLARVKHIDPNRTSDFIEKLHKITTRKFKAGVEKFYLIASTLTPEGPQYEVIATYPRQ